MLLTTLAVLLAAYNFVVMALVLRSSYYTAGRKAAQIVMIWLLPLFGALLCHIVIYSTRQPLPRPDSGFLRNDNPNPPGLG